MEYDTRFEGKVIWAVFTGSVRSECNLRQAVDFATHSLPGEIPSQ
jgi:hypothetical protein